MDDEGMGRALKYALLLRFFWGGEGPGGGEGLWGLSDSRDDRV